MDGVIFRRSGRFDELVRTQLDLFAEDEAELLEEAQEADEAQTHADRDEAEELLRDYQLVVDAIGDRLLDLRETYAATLDDDAADEYRAAFTRAAQALPRFAGLLADQPRPNMRMYTPRQCVYFLRDQAYVHQLDLELVAEARGIFGTKNTTDTVHTALREVVRREKLKALSKMRFDHMPDGWWDELERGEHWPDDDDS